MIKEVIKKLSEGIDLNYDEAKDVVDFFAEGKATDGQIGAFLTAITIKKPTVEEFTGFASRMREKALRVNIDSENIVDSCGTGGDCANTFNISTSAAILAASSGLTVAKHSNFGITSKCGSSNVIQSLGINLVQSPEDALVQVKNNNITFIHSPYFHKSTQHVNPVRKEIGIRTIFNFLGPLVNPAFPTGQVIGVSDPEMCPKIIEVLKNLGIKKALVVHGNNPVLDEISICSETQIYKLENGKIDNFEVSPEDFGIKRANPDEIKGSLPDENARLIRDIFAQKVTGPCLDAVVINAAGLLWVGNKVKNFEDGVEKAYDLVKSGTTLRKLDELVIPV